MFHADQSTLAPRERTLLRRLEREYTPEIARNVLVPLITHQSAVSLRTLDWAVVNWSKKHNIICLSHVPGETTNIHQSYRQTLAFWRRRLFDPFRRRKRICVVVEGEEIQTTLGQANFALWTFRTGVLAYVLSHRQSIEDDMNRVSRANRRARRAAAAQGARRERCELTHAPGAYCVAFASPSQVTFR